MARIKHAETRKFAEDYLASREALIVSLTERYQKLVTWYDSHFGTPCQQVLWLQELDRLKENVKKLREMTLEEAAQLLDEEADKGDKLWDNFIASKQDGPATSYAMIPRKYAKMIRELKDK